jgi:hypothetical protein
VIELADLAPAFFNWKNHILENGHPAERQRSHHDHGCDSAKPTASNFFL